MILTQAHGFNDSEINTYSRIISTAHFSIAVYKNGDKKMQPFEHSHEAYEFIVPFATIPLLRYENSDYIGEVGCCYPVNPFVNHGLGLELESELFSIVADRDFVEAVKAEEGYANRYFFSRFPVSKRLLSAIYSFFSSPNDLVARQVVRILVVEGFAENVDRRKPDKKYFKRIKDSVVFMVRNFTDSDLTIRRVAEASAYSYTYFTKAFCAYMHDTPINYLNKLRIGKAKELMSKSDTSIARLAEESGFRSASAMCEAFKRLTGKSPKEYRKGVR